MVDGRIDPYQVLEVSSKASKDEIKQAFRRKATKHHPDRGGNKEQFQALQLAFDILTDDRRRERFDTTGNANVPKPQDEVAEAIANVLCGIIGELLDKNIDVESQNLLLHLWNAFQKSAQRARELKNKNRNFLNTLNRCGRRIQKNNDDGMIRTIIDRKTIEIKTAIAKLQHEQKVIDDVLNYLCDCKFELPYKSPMQWVIASSSCGV